VGPKRPVDELHPGVALPFVEGVEDFSKSVEEDLRVFAFGHLHVFPRDSVSPSRRSRLLTTSPPSSCKIRTDLARLEQARGERGVAGGVIDADAKREDLAVAGVHGNGQRNGRRKKLWNEEPPQRPLDVTQGGNVNRSGSQ